MQQIAQNKAEQKDKPNYVIPGFAYSLIESFYNEQFNMVYVQKRSDREMKLREELINMGKQQINKMMKDQKLEHRRRKKEIREKLNDEEKKRIELITKPPI